MLKTTLAAVIAALLFAASPGPTMAAAIAPLPSGVVSGATTDNITLAWCGWRCRHWGWRHWGWRRGYYAYAPGWRWRWCRWHPYRCGW